MEVQSLNESKAKILNTTKGLQNVYAHLGEYFESRVLFTTDEPLEFSGYQNELTGRQMRDLGSSPTPRRSCAMPTTPI